MNHNDIGSSHASIKEAEASLCGVKGEVTPPIFKEKRVADTPLKSVK